MVPIAATMLSAGAPVIPTGTPMYTPGAQMTTT